METVVNSSTSSNDGISFKGSGKSDSIAVCPPKKKVADGSVEKKSAGGSLENKVNHKKRSEVCLRVSRKRSVCESAESRVVQPKEVVETGGIESRDWDDPVACQLEGILLSYLQAIFQSAINRVTECGYSEEVAVKAVARDCLYIGGKDSIMTIVDDTLEFLQKGKEADVSRDNEFANLQHLVEYTMLEMINVLREIRPSLSIAEAMWWLLICDLNVLLACTLEGDLSSVLAFEEASGDISPNPSSAQLRSEANSSEAIHPNPSSEKSSKRSVPESSNYLTLPEALKFGSFPDSSNPENPPAPEGKEESLSSMLDNLEKCLGSTRDYVLSTSQTSNSEGKSGAGRKERSKAELAAMRKKRSYQMERTYRAYRSKGGFKSGKLAAFGSFVMEKRSKHPSEQPGVHTSVTSAKVNVQVGTISDGRHPASTCIPKCCCSTVPSKCCCKGCCPTVPSKGCSSKVPQKTCSSTLPSKCTTSSLPSTDTKQKQKSDSEQNSEPKTVTTSSPPKILDYCAGIPYDESLGKYVPQDKKDECILILVPRLQKLQNELESWTEWANEKVMQVSRRLSKERPELKALRQEKEDAWNFEKDKVVLEENTMKRVSEMEHALNNSSGQVERAESGIVKLEVMNSTLKKELSSTQQLATEAAASIQVALEREQKALKNVQACEGQKGSLQEELGKRKNKVVALQQDLGKAKICLHQIEAKWKRERTEKETILAQVDAMRNERERREALSKVEEAKIKEEADSDMQKYVDDIKLLESKISELKVKSESSRIEALRRGAAGSFGGSEKRNVMATKGNHSSAVSKKLTNSQDHLGTQNLRQDRECVMCLSEEMSVVFLPCAHQVVCANCNELHQKQGMKDCPSCRTPIQRRIKVKYAQP